MTTRPHQPRLSDADPIVQIDVARLIATRLLVQANSGGGKSWALRRILEQTYGLAQHIVIDPDGEYHTLREKFDYVLAGRGGDCPATVKAAPLLARRLLELGCSAICDISELQPPERLQFVKKFVEALMESPRSLWHEVIVVVDEAHKFCPEGDSKAPAHAAVVDLASRGRKRGFACVLATQRIAKLDKSAAAECNNKLIGRTGQDVDVERVAKELGMTAKTAWGFLPFLVPGAFYAFGPAFVGAERPVAIKVGGVSTTHPDSGKSRSAPPTPPRDKVKKLLGELANLPAEAEEEAKTVEQLRARVNELERDRIAARNGGDDLAKLQIKADALLKQRNEADERSGTLIEERAALQRELDILRDLMNDAADDIDTLTGRNEAIKRALNRPKPLTPEMLDAMSKSMDPIARGLAAVEIAKRKQFAPNRATSEELVRRGVPPHIAGVTFAGSRPRSSGRQANVSGTDVTAGETAPSGLSAMESRMLTALAQHPEGLIKPKLLLHADYAAGGATSRCFAKLVSEGWAKNHSGGLMVITEAGRATLGHYHPLPTGRDLQTAILTGSRLSDMEKKLLHEICEAYPHTIGKRDVLDKAGYAAGGATSRAFARLVAFDYVKAAGPSLLVAAEELFG